MKTLLINSIATLCCCFISQSAQAEAALPAATVTPNATAASESKPQPGTSPNANADTKTGTALVSNEPKLTNSSTGAGASRLPRIGSGDQLSVEIPDLAKKLEQNPNLIKNARLQLDCQFIDDLPADCVTDNKIVFTITRDIIERVTPRTKVVPLCIRVDNKTISPIPNHIQLVLIAYDWRLALVIIILFMGAVLLCLYGQYTNLVRDGRPPDEAAAETNPKTFNVLRMLPGFQSAMPEPKELAAYSLAKVQMAWWSFFISAAFLFIWLAVGELNSITSSTVVLFGISLGTTVASRMVSSSKQATAQDLNAKEAALEPHVEQLKAQLKNLAGDPKAAADVPGLQQDLHC
jgi:outer membrane murein-binding lipoprotein Lpp